jgi:hypothetical protein
MKIMNLTKRVGQLIHDEHGDRHRNGHRNDIYYTSRNHRKRSYGFFFWKDKENSNQSVPIVTYFI